jgi:hypothetical protein
MEQDIERDSRDRHKHEPQKPTEAMVASNLDMALEIFACITRICDVFAIFSIASVASEYSARWGAQDRLVDSGKYVGR